MLPAPRLPRRETPELGGAGPAQTQSEPSEPGEHRDHIQGMAAAMAQPLVPGGRVMLDAPSLPSPSQPPRSGTERLSGGHRASHCGACEYPNPPGRPQLCSSPSAAPTRSPTPQPRSHRPPRDTAQGAAAGSERQERQRGRREHREHPSAARAPTPDSPPGAHPDTPPQPPGAPAARRPYPSPPPTSRGWCGAAPRRPGAAGLGTVRPGSVRHGSAGLGSARAGAPRVEARREAACEWRRPRSAARSGARPPRRSQDAAVDFPRESEREAAAAAAQRWLRCGSAAASRRPATPRSGAAQPGREGEPAGPRTGTGSCAPWGSLPPVGFPPGTPLCPPGKPRGAQPPPPPNNAGGSRPLAEALVPGAVIC